MLGSYVRSYVGLMLVGSVALWFGLQIWQTAFDQNPLANVMASTLYQGQQISALR